MGGKIWLELWELSDQTSSGIASPSPGQSAAGPGCRRAGVKISLRVVFLAGGDSAPQVNVPFAQRRFCRSLSTGRRLFSAFGVNFPRRAGDFGSAEQSWLPGVAVLSSHWDAFPSSNQAVEGEEEKNQTPSIASGKIVVVVGITSEK